MADVVITVAGDIFPLNATTALLQCRALASGGGEQNAYEVAITYGMNAAQINAAIIQGAIDTYAALGVVIGGSDRKLLLGGAT